MSVDEVHSLREDIATLRVMVEERSRSAHTNSQMLRTIAVTIVIQLFTTVYFAGVKTQLLDRLQQDVLAIQNKLEKL